MTSMPPVSAAVRPTLSSEVPPRLAIARASRPSLMVALMQLPRLGCSTQAIASLIPVTSPATCRAPFSQPGVPPPLNAGGRQAPSGPEKREATPPVQVASDAELPLVITLRTGRGWGGAASARGIHVPPPGRPGTVEPLHAYGAWQP